MKPEDEMYDILSQINQQFEKPTHERLEQKATNNNFKNKIVDFINKEHNETYYVMDIFQNSNKKHGGLHPLGYKLLKGHYTFYEANVTFSGSTQEYIQLVRQLKGLYYMTQPKNNNATVYCTDQYIVDILKLSGGDFKAFSEMVSD